MHSRSRCEQAAMILRGLAMLTLAVWVPSPAAAQPVAGKSQPNRLTFGTVREGATVEGSVRIFVNGDKTAGISVNVDPPPFVRVKQVQLDTQAFGQFGTFIVCDVFISVETASEGSYTGPIRVEAGKQQVEILVSVNVVPREGDETRLLVVDTPFQRFSTSDAALFDPWLKLVKSARLDCSYLEVQSNQSVLQSVELNGFDVVLLGESGILSAQEKDVVKLKKFLEGGGRVIVTANRFFVGTVAKANELLVPYGLQMSDTEPRGGDTFEVDGAGIAEHALTKDVRSLKFHRPSPIRVTDETRGRILVVAPPYPDQGIVAVATAGEGEIVGLGKSLWWSWIASEREQGADNILLMKNLLTKPRKQQ